jgi:hypothetical protein
MSSPSIEAKSPLSAAQVIVSELTGMSPDHQLLALKFAIETLGIQLPGTLPPSPAPSHTQQTPLPPLARGDAHSTDIKSFTGMKSPKSDRQFCAVVAYFYQFEAKPESRKEAIDAETMKDAARLSGWPQVNRWGMTLTNAKNAGYLDAAGSGKFKLSSVGENLVAITLPGDGTPAKSKNAGAKKKAKKPAPKKRKQKS